MLFSPKYSQNNSSSFLFTNNTHDLTDRFSTSESSIDITERKLFLAPFLKDVFFLRCRPVEYYVRFLFTAGTV